MKFHKILMSRLFWFGVIGLAGLFLGGATTCKAQEVNPAQFTDTGVEDAYPAKKPLAKKPGAKSSVKTLTAAHANANQTASNRTMVRKRKTHHPVRKTNVALTPNL
jgi:hypothetical protein